MKAALVDRRFVIGDCGDTVNDDMSYIGSFSLNNGSYVGHIFEGKVNENI